jgi:hypothetical protein
LTTRNVAGAGGSSSSFVTVQVLLSPSASVIVPPDAQSPEMDAV